MLRRCTNPRDRKYPLYGGRGIRVCEAWSCGIDGFRQYLIDVGQQPTQFHTIDRIDSNGNYTPENVRWATVIEQNRNKRRTRRVAVNGVEMLIAEASAITGLSVSCIGHRLERGQPLFTGLELDKATINGHPFTSDSAQFEVADVLRRT